eukprot:352817-Chlamydomonas_euryale.AAC.9
MMTIASSTHAQHDERPQQPHEERKPFHNHAASKSSHLAEVEQNYAQPSQNVSCNDAPVGPLGTHCAPLVVDAWNEATDIPLHAQTAAVQTRALH